MLLPPPTAALGEGGAGPTEQGHGGEGGGAWGSWGGGGSRGQGSSENSGQGLNEWKGKTMALLLRGQN